MIQVSVKSTEPRNQRGNAAKTGKPYNMYFQECWAFTVDRNGNPSPYPVKSELILDVDDQGRPMIYPVGDYTLAQSSVYIDRNGSWAIFPRLVPLKKPSVS